MIGRLPETLEERGRVSPGRRSRGFRRLLFLILCLGVLLAGGFLAAIYVQSAGNRFFDTGKHILGTLLAVAGSAKAGDFGRMQRFFAADFQGTRLGLGSMKAAEEKDGVHRLLFTSDGASVGREAALDEWKSHLGGFDSVDEVTLQIDRLEEFQSAEHLVATVRFEAIGTLRGISKRAIDRATFRFTFRGPAGGPLITSAALIQ